MTHFYSEEKLKTHNIDYPLCHNNQPAKIEYPTKDKAFVMFKNYNYKFKCPFVIYADFESVLIKKIMKIMKKMIKTCTVWLYALCCKCY